MDYEAVIGLEIHVEMKTKSKMFSSAPVSFGYEPNTQTVPLDLAFPGTMPTVNKQAVINAIRVSHALHMDIDRELWFDRKNYFYSDLPKGYQITQQHRPIGKNGYLTVNVGGVDKKIRIERLHMEEDTCKQLHSYDCTLLDYNRAGVPLIEIVSLPDIRSGEEASKYVEQIRSIVTFLDVSDGKMEEGSLRCDVNISIRPVGSETFGTKVEIKNLNSIANVQKAIDFEYKRQVELASNGQEVQQETRRFDEASKQTVLMRIKTDAVDYKYFIEPNITPIRLSETFIQDAIETMNELAESKLKRYRDMGLNEYDANILISNKDISNYFDRATRDGASYKLIANWIIGDIQSVLNKNNMSIADFPIQPESLSELVKLIENGTIQNKHAREIFNKLLENPSLCVKELSKDISKDMIGDENEIVVLINELLDNNPQSITEYKNGRDRVVGFLMGQLMKKTGGKINPAIANKLLLEQLKRR